MIKLAFGSMGYGKSMALQDMVRTATRKQHWAAAIADPRFEWGLQSHDGSVNPRWRGDPPVIYTATADPKSALELMTHARDNGGGLVVFPHPWESIEVAALCVQCGDCIFVDDEIDQTARYKGWETNPIRNMVHYGRHLPDIEGTPRETHIYGAARRPQNIHTDLTELADEVFLFHLSGKNTIQRCLQEGWITEDDVPSLRTAPKWHYVKWNSDGSIARGILDALEG